MSDYVSGWHGLADLLFRRGAQEEADSLGCTLIAHGRFASLGYLLRATSARLRGAIAEARYWIAQAVIHDSTDVEPLRARRELLFLNGKSDEAAVALRELINLRPEEAPAHHNLGTLLLRSTRNQEAAEVYERAAKLRPKFFQTHLYLGFCHQQLGNLTLAQETYGNALVAANSESERNEANHYLTMVSAHNAVLLS